MNHVAICSDGYVFVDDRDDMINLYPVRSRTPIISEADDALTDNGWRRASDWHPTRVACQIVCAVVHVKR